MSDTPNIRLGWRLRVRMAENRIPTATELKRRLDAIGYDITSAQLSRIVDERPAQVPRGGCTQPVQVLNHQRAIQSQLLAQRLHSLPGRLRTQDH